MADGRGLLEYFDKAQRQVETYGGARWFLDWVRKIRRPYEHDPEFFLGEYTFIVSVSGFRESTVKKRWPQLREALFNFDLLRLGDLSIEEIERRYMDKMLRNRAKAKAVATTLRRYVGRPQDIDALLLRLDATKDPDVLKTLPYIGDTLKYHFARNLGLDVAKPDVHLLRLADRFGFGGDNAGVQAMCEHVARYRDDRVGAVDYILWYRAKVEASPGDLVV